MLLPVRFRVVLFELEGPFAFVELLARPVLFVEPDPAFEAVDPELDAFVGADLRMPVAFPDGADFAEVDFDFAAVPFDPADDDPADFEVDAFALVAFEADDFAPDDFVPDDFDADERDELLRDAEPRVVFLSPIGSAPPTAFTAPPAIPPTPPASLPAVFPTDFTILPGSGIGCPPPIRPPFERSSASSCRRHAEPGTRRACLSRS